MEVTSEGIGRASVRRVEEAFIPPDVFELARDARRTAIAARKRAQHTRQVSERIIADSLAIAEVSRRLLRS